MASFDEAIEKGVKRAKTSREGEEEEEEEWKLPPHDGLVVRTVEMHAGGEPLRIFKLKDSGLGEPYLTLMCPISELLR